MGSRKEVPKRRSNRLQGYDYSLAGSYFVSMVTHKREALFGEVIDGEMRLNAIGDMVREEWIQITNRFPSAECDEYVVMPNHFHGIIVISEPDVGADLVSARREFARQRAGTSPAPTPKKPTLGDIIRVYKSITTNRYIACVRNFGWKPFDRRLWQRNYHDRIIRDEAELRQMREYIAANLLMWAEDEENPRNVKWG